MISIDKHYLDSNDEVTGDFNKNIFNRVEYRCTDVVIKLWIRGYVEGTIRLTILCSLGEKQRMVTWKECEVWRCVFFFFKWKTRECLLAERRGTSIETNERQLVFMIHKEFKDTSSMRRMVSSFKDEGKYFWWMQGRQICV